MEIKQGMLLSLKCRVKGDKNPKIIWLKDGNLIDPHSDPYIEITAAVKQSRLRIRNLRLTDSGNYSCIGSSESDQMSRWVYVTVTPNMDNGKSWANRTESPFSTFDCTGDKCENIYKDPNCNFSPESNEINCSRPVADFRSYEQEVTTRRAYAEEDFVLDQYQASYTTRPSYGSPVDGLIDKCSLPEFNDSADCVQVNSHFYAFIGTALACSVMILLLGSCLGYIRRRRIIKQQERSMGPDSGDGNTHMERTSGGKFQRIFEPESHVGAEVRYVESSSNMQTSTSVDRYNTTVATGYPYKFSRGNCVQVNTMHLGTQTTQSTPFVILNSTTPLSLHPITMVPNIQEQSVSPQAIVYSPSSITLNSPTKGLTQAQSTIGKTLFGFIPSSETTVQCPVHTSRDKKSEILHSSANGPGCRHDRSQDLLRSASQANMLTSILGTSFGESTQEEPNLHCSFITSDVLNAHFPATVNKQSVILGRPSSLTMADVGSSIKENHNVTNSEDLLCDSPQKLNNRNVLLALK